MCEKTAYVYLNKLKIVHYMLRQWRVKNRKYNNYCVAILVHFTLELVVLLCALFKMYNRP